MLKVPLEQLDVRDKNAATISPSKKAVRVGRVDN